MSEIRAEMEAEKTFAQLANKENIEKLQGLLEMQSLTNALQPFVRRIEFIERELQRTYQHAEQKLQHRQDTHMDDEWTEELRRHWGKALEDYAEALLKVTNRL